MAIVLFVSLVHILLIGYFGSISILIGFISIQNKDLYYFLVVFNTSPAKTKLLVFPPPNREKLHRF